MPKSRQLKLSVFEDPDIANLSPDARWALLAIWQNCDALGRVTMCPKRLWRHAFCFTGITQDEAGNILEELIQNGELEHADDDDDTKFDVPSFLEHNDPHINEIRKAKKESSYDSRSPSVADGQGPVPVRRELSESSSVSVSSSSSVPSNGVQRTARAKSESGPPSEPPGFQAWYEAYPKHKARAAAAKAYLAKLKAALKKAKSNGRPEAKWQEIDQELSEYLVKCVDYQKGFKPGDGLNREMQFIPYPATWLNQEGFKDEPET